MYYTLGKLNDSNMKWHYTQFKTNTKKIIVSYGTISTFFFNITTITYVNIIMLSSVYWHMYLQQGDNITETVYAYN